MKIVLSILILFMVSLVSVLVIPSSESETQKVVATEPVVKASVEDGEPFAVLENQLLETPANSEPKPHDIDETLAKLNLLDLDGSVASAYEQASYELRYLYQHTPELAVNWLLSLTQNWQTEALTRDFLSFVSDQYPDEVLDIAHQLSHPEKYQDVLVMHVRANVGKRYHSVDFLDAYYFSEEVTNNIRLGFYRGLGENSPMNLLEVLVNDFAVEQEHRTELVKRSIRHLISESESNIDKIQALGGFDADLFYILGRSKIALDVGSFSDWLQSLPSGESRDAAILGYVDTGSESLIGRQGIELASSIVDRTERLNAMRSIYLEWSSVDTLAANHFLNASNFTEEEISGLSHSL